MKMSAAILKGMERFPKMAIGSLQDGKIAACAIGCVNYAVTNDAYDWPNGHWEEQRQNFEEAFGMDIVTANNRGILREDIAGMLMAIGE